MTSFTIHPNNLVPNFVQGFFRPLLKARRFRVNFCWLSLRSCYCWCCSAKGQFDCIRIVLYCTCTPDALGNDPASLHLLYGSQYEGIMAFLGKMIFRHCKSFFSFINYYFSNFTAQDFKSYTFFQPIPDKSGYLPVHHSLRSCNKWRGHFKMFFSKYKYLHRSALIRFTYMLVEFDKISWWNEERERKRYNSHRTYLPSHSNGVKESVILLILLL